MTGLNAVNVEFMRGVVLERMEHYDDYEDLGFHVDRYNAPYDGLLVTVYNDDTDDERRFTIRIEEYKE